MNRESRIVRRALRCAHTFIVGGSLCIGMPASAQEDGTTRVPVLARDGQSVVSLIPSTLPGEPFLAQARLPAARSMRWERMSCPPNVFVKAISMASAQVGFAAAELGIVLRSTDGGDTWQTALNQGFPYYYYGVHAFSESTVLVSGFQNQTLEGVIRWSDDGGATWGPHIVLPAPPALDWLYMVRFADADRGVIQGSVGVIFHTTNGGRTADDWSISQPTDNWWQGTFTFLKDGRAWMTGYDNFRSPDGGASWTRIADADPLFDGANGIRPSGRGYIGGGTISPSVRGWVYQTADGGDSWTHDPVLSTPYPIRGILCLDDRRAWAVGGNYFSGVGGIWGTTDGGATWTLEQNTGGEMLDITSVRVSAKDVHVFAAGQVSHIWRATVNLREIPAK